MKKEIDERFLTINSYSRSGEKQNKIEKIVVHWVGNVGSSAIANRNYFESLATSHNTYASSHYIIGLNGEIIQCIPENEVAFHSGSYSMNRKSIGIENCHPDWEGKFNEKTYKSLVALCVNICKRHNLGIDAIIRHYDVTEKECPRYYVRNEQAWIQFKNDVSNKLGQAATTIVAPKVERSDEPVQKYKNGSTKEIIYADTNLTKIIGNLSPYEECDSLGLFNNRVIVIYKVDNSNDNYKIGFAKWLKGLEK